MAFDLTTLPSYYLGKYDSAKIAEVAGALPSTVTVWTRKQTLPLEALQALLSFDPSPLEEVRPFYERPTLESKLAILMPANGAPHAETVECLMKLYDPREMVFKRVGFNNLSVARNSLLAWWLAGPCEWALWFDSDQVLPCGDAQWFKSICDLRNLPDIYAGINAVHRMLVHKLKRGISDALMVSIVYVGRKRGAPPQFGNGESPEMRALVRRGPQDRLLEVPWCGFGGVLTHRKIFEDVIAQQGEEMRVTDEGIRKHFGYSHAVFSPVDQNTPGDDVPACNRIRRAGHKVYLDLAVVGGHVGSKVFSFSDL